MCLGDLRGVGGTCHLNWSWKNRKLWGANVTDRCICVWSK